MKSGDRKTRGVQPRQGLNSVAAFLEQNLHKGSRSGAFLHCCGWSSTQPRSVHRRSATVLKASRSGVKKSTASDSSVVLADKGVRAPIVRGLYARMTFTNLQPNIR